jgi:hypothetical protein
VEKCAKQILSKKSLLKLPTSKKVTDAKLKPEKMEILGNYASVMATNSYGDCDPNLHQEAVPNWEIMGYKLNETWRNKLSPKVNAKCLGLDLYQKRSSLGDFKLFVCNNCGDKCFKKRGWAILHSEKCPRSTPQQKNSWIYRGRTKEHYIAYTREGSGKRLVCTKCSMSSWLQTDRVYSHSCRNAALVTCTVCEEQLCYLTAKAHTARHVTEEGLKKEIEAAHEAKRTTEERLGKQIRELKSSLKKQQTQMPPPPQQKALPPESSRRAKRMRDVAREYPTVSLRADGEEAKVARKKGTNEAKEVARKKAMNKGPVFRRYNGKILITGKKSYLALIHHRLSFYFSQWASLSRPANTPSLGSAMPKIRMGSPSR